ncbi:MAG: LCP family protein [Gracilibacteraceae bacterium]|jgi:LCP family protein required for cell wall assembly|nr:LCP family protein [Gracilibacteraceae bacterium]
MPRKKKKKNQRQRIGGWLLLAAICLTGVLIGTAVFGLVWFREAGVYWADRPNTMLQPLEAAEKLEKRVSILLIGADKRPGETAYNTDTLMLATVDPNTQVVSMLSILRDTRVLLNGEDVRINSIVMRWGVSSLIDQVENLTGIRPDGYILTNFEGFKDVVDTLGGIEIDVERDMYFETGDEGEDGFIDLRAGLQTLDGLQALQYARFRNDALADVSRSGRQQKVLKAIAGKCLEPSVLTKLPTLAPQLLNAVESDISMPDLMRLVKVGIGFAHIEIVSQTIPGNFLDLDGVSYWEVDKAAARLVGENLLLGIVSNRVFDGGVLNRLDAETRARMTGAQAEETATEEPEPADETADETAETPAGETARENPQPTETPAEKPAEAVAENPQPTEDPVEEAVAENPEPAEAPVVEEAPVESGGDNLYTPEELEYMKDWPELAEGA